MCILHGTQNLLPQYRYYYCGGNCSCLARRKYTSVGPLVDVFTIDWSGPDVPAMPSPWGILWVPGAASSESEVAFWDGNGLKGPHLSAV